MSGAYHAWEEITISEPCCDRIVHYYLKRYGGNSLLAAVGTEQSQGRVLYEISEEFLEAFGSNSTINANTKWTARRELVKWLIALVYKKEPPPTLSNLPLIPEENGGGSDIQKEEKLPQEDSLKRVPKKLRSRLALQRRKSRDVDMSDAINMVSPNEIAPTTPATPNLNIDRPSNEPTGIQIVKPNSIQNPSFEVGDYIEILSQDSGMNGCWFRAKVLKIFKRCFKVQYIDVDYVKRCGKLEEWVSIRQAAPDKLNMRHSGRITIRPFPPEEEDYSNHKFEVGSPIDAWWCDGWWEGVVVTASSLGSSDNYNVFLLGERKFVTTLRKDMRVSRDWTGNAWVTVKPQDLFSVMNLSYH